MRSAAAQRRWTGANAPPWPPPRDPLPADSRRPLGIGTAGGQPVTTHDRLSLGFGTLVTLERPGRSIGRCLVVAPLAGGFALLMRDLVCALLGHFGEVSVTDWADARYVPPARGTFGFDDNVLETAAMIRALGPDLHVVAVCQGVVPALLATTLLAVEDPPLAPRSLSLVGGPVLPLAAPTRVVRLIRARSCDWFEEHVIEPVPPGFPGEGRAVYPRRHQLVSFGNYVARHLMGGGELFWKLLADDGIDPVGHPFAALAFSMMDLPAPFFLGTVRSVFHGEGLRDPDLAVAGRPLDFEAVRSTALLTVEGEEDDISAPGQTAAAHELCRAVPDEARRRLLVPGSGHFSLFHGRRCRDLVVPAICDFVRGVTPGRAACL